MAQNVNRVVVSGNLTRDPELRHTPSGAPVCNMRVAVNGRIRDASGEWSDKPNYFNVTVWGNRGETCAQYLSKGRPVLIDGRLDWHEWDGDSGHRESVEIVAEMVQFLGSRKDGESPTRTSRDEEPQYEPPAESETQGAPDDDFPFE